MEHGEETIRMILPEAGNGPFVEGALNGVNFRIPTGSHRTDPAAEQWMNGFTATGGMKLE